LNHNLELVKILVGFNELVQWLHARHVDGIHLRVN
jgi:hypothetical protein